MIPLFLFFGSVWAPVASLELPESTTALQMSEPARSPFPLVSVSGTPEINSEASSLSTTELPEESNSPGHQIFLPSSTPYPAEEVSSPGISIAASSGLPLPRSVLSQEVSTNRKSMLLEISDAANTPAVSGMSSLGLHTVTGETMTTSSLETSDGTNGLPVTTATSSLETSDGTSGPPVTTATSSLETSNGTSGPPNTTATSSLVASSGTTGPPVIMATRSSKTSVVTHGPPVTIETGLLTTSKGTSRPSVTRETSMKTAGPIFGVGISTVDTSSSSPQNSGQRTNGTMLVAVLVALLVVIVLVVLLLLWRQRQKRKTGVLTLSRGGNRNGVVDAWAGRAQVSDEEAMSPEGASGGNKDSGALQGEGPGQRPTLTTFFGKRMPRQGSLALEEIKAGSAAKLKGEEEPLVGSEDGAADASASDGPEAREAGAA
uniref:Sialoglycoprotein n=1 Tax=Sus scrofa TaxID=9823 RepID=D9MNC9_PIG|nr:sialoglycoprotein [Sus scrofa]AGH09782.1 sialoglycoprotein [Sus scrofa]